MGEEKAGAHTSGSGLEDGSRDTKANLPSLGALEPPDVTDAIAIDDIPLSDYQALLQCLPDWPTAIPHYFSIPHNRDGGGDRT